MFKPTHSLDKFKKREDVFELESQFILRLPLGAAQQLRRAVQSGAMNLKDRMSIELQPDMRNGTVRFDGMVFSAKVHSPGRYCRVHTRNTRTLDRKTHLQTATFGQMVICKETFDQSSQDEDGTGRKRDKKKEDKKYLWNHGITPPLKNVRKRRFRKTARKKYIEQPDVEKEVKALFKLDNEAVKVRWEVVTEDSDKKESMPISTGETTNIITLSPKASKANLLDVAISDIFGEAVSSSEDEAEINVMDLHDEESSQGPIQTSDLLAHAMGTLVSRRTHTVRLRRGSRRRRTRIARRRKQRTG
ncbi:PREDICTED: transcription initiation factor TFIID subunit 7-like [Priapulus caudatus]|uniref:Transcription initiation factor TFIID subunit 7-like n=1 Tax=Priapulus caudatus TaxID=37621 RepID=A0ABM1DYI2_PRICU|nr:PREDICTED: transcription initiation factor TFIID subunit 7-like [Priapulus caudatus]